MSTSAPVARPFSILRPAVWHMLGERLDAAVAQDAVLSLVRDAVLRPLQLLEAIATDAPAALGDDFFAAERVRALLHLANPWNALPGEAASIVAKLHPDAYQPGVLHHGALMILGLTAVRVAPDDQVADFLRTVHGLALAASPIEVLGRMEPGGPSPVAIEAILRTLVGLGDVTGTPSAVILRPFAQDAVERGRWRCLSSLFGEKGLGAFAIDRARTAADPHRARWDGATAEGIDGVNPRQIVAGAPMTLQGNFPVPLPATTSVVFTSASDALVVATTGKGSKTKLPLTGPAGARTGWVGFSDTAMVAASNSYRQSVRDFWAAIQLPSTVMRSDSFVDCMREAPVPVQLIPDIGRADPARPGVLLSQPPRTATNRVVAGTPVIESAGVGPSPVEPHGTLTLTWTSDATFVWLDGKQRLDPSGSRTVTAPDEEGAVAFTLTPVLQQAGAAVEGVPTTVTAIVRARGRIADVLVEQGGRGAPFVAGRPVTVTVTLTPATQTGQVSLHLGAQTLSPDATSPGSVTFTIAADDVRSGVPLQFTVVLDAATTEGTSGPPDSRDVRRDLGPFAVGSARPVRLVLFRPTVLRGDGQDSVSADARDALLAAIERRLGIACDVTELPWAEDPLAVLGSDLTSATDPRVGLLLDHLSSAAARTAGFEDAVWVVLVPDPPRADDRRATSVAPGFEAHQTAEAAAAVAVCDSLGLVQLLAALAPPRADAGAVARLRLVGRRDTNGDIRLEPPREEIRRVGSGAGFDAALVAVSLDSDGVELGRVPVMRAASAATGAFVLLLPVAPEVTRVELRDKGDQVLVTLPRTLGLPNVKDVAVQPDNGISWSYSHTRVARPTVQIELVGSGAVPFMAADPCRSVAQLPQQRLPPLEGLRARVVASDGWNAFVSDDVSLPAGSERLLLRRVNARMFWADTTVQGTLLWTLNGRPLTTRRADGRVLTLDADATGLLVVSSPGSETQPPIDDSRSLEARDA